MVDPNANPDFALSYWAKLSPLFRAAHNRLRQARGLPSIPPPKVDCYKQPRGSVRPVDPDDPEAIATATDFGREVSNNPRDEVFLDWVRSHASECSHEEMQRALDDTKYVHRRPRRWLTEFWYAWICAVVRSKPKPWGKLDAQDRLGADARTIRRALSKEGSRAETDC